MSECAFCCAELPETQAGYRLCLRCEKLEHDAMLEAGGECDDCV